MDQEHNPVTENFLARHLALPFAPHQPGTFRIVKSNWPKDRASLEVGLDKPHTENEHEFPGNRERNWTHTRGDSMA